MIGLPYQLLLALLLVIGQVSAAPKKALVPDCVCTLEFAPVCCEGQEFSNSCFASCSGFKDCPKGECADDGIDDVPLPPPCVCTKELNLQCCDGVEYGNPCLAECAGAKNCVAGTCDDGEDCVCIALFDPVCCDGTQFGNACEAGCEKAQNCEDGECPVPCPCTRELNPQCCQGKEFANPCLAECEGAINCVAGPCGGGTGEVLDAEIQGKWKLLRIRDGFMLKTFKGATADITFENTGDNVGNVGGSSGCNLYSSQYTVTDVGKIEFGVFISTLIACQEPEATLEGLFGSALDKVKSFDVVNGILRLKQGRRVLMTFTKDTAEPPGCVCTADFTPVCCDGQQHGNQCSADCSGAINCTPGKCPGLTCALGSAIAKCAGNLCESTKCEAYPEAECLINGCAEPLFNGDPVELEVCSPVFVFEDKIVDCEADTPVEPPGCVCTADFTPVCCENTQYGNQCTADCSGAINCTPGKCPGLTCAPGSAQARCVGDICENAKCEAQPDADCTINPCGEPLFDGEPVDIAICAPVFVFEDKLVDCELDECLCSLLLDPVCCGGKEFDNQCLADCAGAEGCLKGTCSDECLCSLLLDPVCCDGKEFDNQCLADCEGAEGCLKGTCSDDCLCSLLLDPVCCDGKEFDNQCLADCAGAEGCLKGTCSDDCICNLLLDPVCCDGKEFDNQCFADCAGAEGCIKGTCGGSGSEVLDKDIQGEWNLLRILQDNKLKTFRGATASIKFTNDGDNVGAVNGNNGCNFYFSDYDVVDAGVIVFGSLGSTKIGCNGPPRDLELLFNDLFSKVGSFDITNGILRLKKGGRVLFTFTKEEEGCVDEIICLNDETVECYEDPCQFAQCDAPNSSCLSINCAEGVYRGTPLGQCGALFVDNDTCEIVEDCSGVKDVCADNVKCANDLIVDCFADPCEINSCDAPNTECIPIYCTDGEYNGTPIGPCQALFVDKDTCEVVTDCGDAPVCACPEFFSPVCCDGQEFANQCFADCEGLTECTDGPCEGGCVCPDVYLPVCCDGVTYGNDCEADCVGAANCKAGECDVGCVCPEIFAPVCCDGRQYDNDCFAECESEDLEKCTQGPCDVVKEVCADSVKCFDDVLVNCFADPCEFNKCDAPNSECLSIYCNEGEYKGTPIGPCQALFVDKDSCEVVTDCGNAPVCACPEIFQPVCCDGQEFSNQCFANCEVLTECTEGPCEDEGCFCPAVYKPVCCDDNVQYGNGCEAGCADATGCKPGRCRIEDDNPALCQCANIELPQCCDGEKFGNPCLAACAFKTNCKDGPCPPGKRSLKDRFAQFFQKRGVRPPKVASDLDLDIDFTGLGGPNHGKDTKY